MTILCLRRNGPSTGIRPSVIAAASSPVRITTRDRWATRVAISVTRLRWSVSTSTGSIGAIAFTKAGSSSAADLRSTLTRTSRSAISRSTRSPARAASAPSSSAASIAWSSLG